MLATYLHSINISPRQVKKKNLSNFSSSRWSINEICSFFYSDNGY